MTDDPLLGRQLGNFRIERVIGRGGMAQVYQGWDVKLKRPVAVKVVDARYRDDPSYAQRFVREAQTVAAWRQENIVQVYFADEEDGLYYFAMEYIDGQSLDELLAEYQAEGRLMPQGEVLRLGRAVARALDHAHRRGVIHRDVKPANVLVAADGRVVLTDFGLAMDVELGSQGEVFGSSHYIAPEQARSSAAALPQSDLYSLGVILFEMLTGSVPFDDPSPTSVALQHVTLPPPSPRALNPDLGVEVESVLLQALAKSPADRYQTGAELIAALEAALLNDRTAPRNGPAAAAEDSLLGQQLDEYRLDAMLGRGGMARIYRGLDVRLKRHVAIKVIDTPFRADPGYVLRFEREAQAIAQLEYPHIVRLYRYGEANDVLYMAMQYIEGTDLRALLAAYRRDGEPIPPDEACRIVRDICLALDFAHGKGVIHRDVKPSNIMLDRGGRAILTDFGLALLTDIGTRGEVLGSLHYVAPEQAISSAGAVPQSDLYSVGVILYEMFTGHLPFDAADPLDIAMLHMTEPPPLPRSLRPGLSPELEAVILKALAKDPADRCPTGAALAAAVEAALEAGPVTALSARPSTGRGQVAARPLPPLPAAVAGAADQEPAAKAPSPPAPGKRPARRRFLLAGITAIVSLGIILLVAFLWGPLGGVAATPTPTGTPTQIAAAPTSTAVPATATGVRTSTAAATATATATATRTPAPTATPSPSPSVTATKSRPTASATPPTPTEPAPTHSPTPLPTAPAATARPKPTPRPAPTPTPLTLEGLRGWILFLSNRLGAEAVFALSPDGTEIIPVAGRQLYEQAAEAERQQPNGALWLEVRVYEGNSDIWRVGIGEDLRLTSNPAADYDPAWSPGGKEFAFVSGRRGSDDIFVMDIDIGGERQLTYYGGYDKHPTWSPDGLRIAFWSDRETGHRQIWIVNADGTGLTNLSNSPYDDWDPVWIK